MADDRSLHESVIESLRGEPIDHPLRKAKLDQALFYALIARTEYELVSLIDGQGEGVIEDYRLRPSGQQGIWLDWDKLDRERDFYIPRTWLDRELITDASRAIFSHDEGNAFGFFSVDPSDQSLLDRIIFGPDDEGSGEAKLEALRDPRWRGKAKEYSLRLLDVVQARYGESVKLDFQPAFQSLFEQYRSEMTQSATELVASASVELGKDTLERATIRYRIPGEVMRWGEVAFVPAGFLPGMYDYVREAIGAESGTIADVTNFYPNGQSKEDVARFKGSGVASALLERMIDDSRGEGATDMIMVANPGDVHGFLGAKGFRQYGMLGFHLPLTE